MQGNTYPDNYVIHLSDVCRPTRAEIISSGEHHVIDIIPKVPIGAVACIREGGKTGGLTGKTIPGHIRYITSMPVTPSAKQDKCDMVIVFIYSGLPSYALPRRSSLGHFHLY